MSRHSRPTSSHGRGQRPAAGPTQRQLRAGELIRHALVEILREEDFADPDLAGVSVTVTEVRMSPDLKHAHCFVEPLGGVHADKVVSALNRSAKFLRGRLGHGIDMKFTPDLRFLHDESFNEAARIDRLFDDPRVRRDLEAEDEAAAGDGEDGYGA
ncbi:30S ribosome-binding factor RbfA [Phenylobacterium montanum]|uniref:Ribosome-binding factor A n=1 Tax=Phenylobacterium montanum TaxID=2823693 RepID=A0A975FX98_9CAUL|nr:30S ribosome-binding factor RbfA [Caulobacter sp. S6]QUD86841.1 30S ribosome-binding factor RbfA [Caulobacter sp. S6]